MQYIKILTYVENYFIKMLTISVFLKSRQCRGDNLGQPVVNGSLAGVTSPALPLNLTKKLIYGTAEQKGINDPDG